MYKDHFNATDSPYGWGVDMVMSESIVKTISEEKMVIMNLFTLVDKEGKTTFTTNSRCYQARKVKFSTRYEIVESEYPVASMKRLDLDENAERFWNLSFRGEEETRDFTGRVIKKSDYKDNYRRLGWDVIPLSKELPLSEKNYLVRNLLTISEIDGQLKFSIMGFNYQVFVKDGVSSLLGIDNIIYPLNLTHTKYFPDCLPQFIDHENAFSSIVVKLYHVRDDKLSCFLSIFIGELVKKNRLYQSHVPKSVSIDNKRLDYIIIDFSLKTKGDISVLFDLALLLNT